MNIAVFTESFPNISETFINNQIIGLLNSGHSITILSKNKPKSLLIHDDVLKYNLLEKLIYEKQVPQALHKRIFTAFGIFFKLDFKKKIKLLKTFNFLKYKKKSLNLSLFYHAVSYIDLPDFDIIHAHFGPAGNHALLMKELGVLKGEIITTFYGFDATDFSIRKKALENGFYSNLFKIGSLFITGANYTKIKVCELNCPADKTFVIPATLDIEKFTRKTSYLKNRQNVNIITVARVTEMKGLKYSIKAVAELINSENIRNINFSMIGSGELMTELEDLIKECNAENNIFLLGARKQEFYLDLYENVDIFLLTSIKTDAGIVETQGLVIQEAQAMEIPVVVSHVGGVGEGGINKQTGFLVK